MKRRLISCLVTGVLIFVSACSLKDPTVTTERSSENWKERSLETSASSETAETSECKIMDEEAVNGILRSEAERVVQLLKEQFTEEDIPHVDETEDLYRFAEEHKKSIVAVSDDDWVCIDRFLSLYDPENGLDDEGRIRNYQEALRFTEAVSEEDKIKLIEQAKEKITEMRFFSDPVVWTSVNGYYYYPEAYHNRKMEPGAALTVEAKERSELGEGAVMIFCFYRASEEKEWKLINYGY
ncbi:MAG: hypothetical protein IJL98_00220 [Lachnospiraceae bacterium]|nr:hypothetical protein [Lachnospiraceae bacterium]